MNNPWLIAGVGILFCCSGVFLFLHNVYEEKKSITGPLLVIGMGVLLIVAGTAKYFGLFH